VRRNENIDMELVLTADGVGVLECGEEARIDINVEVLVGLELRIPCSNALTDPVGEIISNNRICNVDEELLR